MSDLFSSLHSASELAPDEKITADDLDFYSLLRRSSSDGKLFFNQRRAVIFDTDAIGSLRRQLVSTLGTALAMGVLFRFGYAQGYQDAEMLGDTFDWTTDADWLAAGPAIHTLEGIVQVEAKNIEFDRDSGHFNMHGVWRNSYEAEEHLKHFGPQEDPVCWTLTGYASGYTSRFFGRELLAIETTCMGQGDEHCYWEIKPVEAWGEAAQPYLAALEEVDVSAQLFEANKQLRKQTDQLTQLNKMSAELNQAKTVEQIFKVVAAKANSIISGSRASVALLNQDHTEFEILALDGEQGAIPVGAKLPLEGTAIGKAVRENRLINTLDITRSEFADQRQLAKQGLQSTMTIPLNAGGHSIGTLNVGSKDVNAYDSHDEKVMLQMASLLASSVENRRLLEQTQERAVQLERSNRFLDSVVENIPTMIFVKDAEELRFVQFNKAGEELLGLSRGDFIGKNDYDFFPKDEADFFVAKDRETLNSGQLLDIPEEPIQTATGETRWLHTRKVPILDADGTPRYLLGISEDITDQKATQEQLSRLSMAVEQSANTIVITDLDGYIQYANPRFVETTGYTLEEAIGQHTRILSSGKTAQEAYKKMWETISAGEQWSGEFHNVKKNGELYWESATISPIKNAAGQITHYLAVKEEITEQKEREEAVARNEALLRNVIDATPDWIFVTDSRHRYQLVNQSYAATFGFTPDQVVGKTALELGLPEDIVKGNPQEGIKGFWPDDEEVLASGQVKEVNVEPTIIDGEQRYINSVKIPLTNAEGQPNALLCYVRDITQRQLTEAAMARQATELATVAEVSTATATILNPDELLHQVVNLTKERFELYHAHIYLLDSARALLNLAAGAGEVGKQMVQEGWSIGLAEEHSLVARTARTRAGTLVNDVQSEPDHLPNPLLPDTQAELAVPMIVGDEVLGVLDVQADTPDYFVEDDIKVHSILAAQVAAALRNATLYKQGQQSLEQTERLYAASRAITVAANQAEVVAALVAHVPHANLDRIVAALIKPTITAEIVAEVVAVWDKYGQESQFLGNRFTAAQIPLLKILKSDDLLLVDNVATTAQLDPRSKAVFQHLGVKSVAVLPLSAGEQLLGWLLLETTDTFRTFSLDEIRPYSALNGQASIALEGRRLLEESQQRARREQILREVTTRIRNSADVNSVMRTAAQELGRALGRQTVVTLGSQAGGPITTPENGENIPIKAGADTNQENGKNARPEQKDA